MVSSVVASAVLASAAKAGDAQARRAAGSASIGRRRAAGRRWSVRGSCDIGSSCNGEGRAGRIAGAKKGAGPGRAPWVRRRGVLADRSEEHTSELQSLMRISYAVFCLKKKNNTNTATNNQDTESK